MQIKIDFVMQLLWRFIFKKLTKRENFNQSIIPYESARCLKFLLHNFPAIL